MTIISTILTIILSLLFLVACGIFLALLCGGDNSGGTQMDMGQIAGGAATGCFATSSSGPERTGKTLTYHQCEKCKKTIGIYKQKE